MSLWTEEPGGLLSMGSQRTGHDCTTKYSTAQWAFADVMFKMTVIHFIVNIPSVVWDAGFRFQREPWLETHIWK